MDQASIVCPNCQTPNPAKNLYCQNCGKPLIPATPRAVPQPVDLNLTQRPVPESFPPVPPAPVPLYPQPTPDTPAIPSQSMPPAEPMSPNIPPQGFPPAPYPPLQGTPPQGYAPQGMPPQQAYYPPPAPYVAPAAPKIDQLGTWADGWADLVNGGAEKAGEVEKAFVEAIQSRKIPQVQLDRMDVPSLAGMKSYQLVRSPWGTLIFSSRAAGIDLALSWSLYVQRKPKWMTILILVGVAFGLSLLTSIPLAGSASAFVLNWIFGTFNWLFPVAILGLIAGYILKGSIWYLFIEGLSESALDDAMAVSLAVQHSVCEAVEKAGLDASKLRSKRTFQGGEQTWKV